MKCPNFYRKRWYVETKIYFDWTFFFRYDNILKEYARYLPFGLGVATTFLAIMHCSGEPPIGDDSVECTIRRIFDHGGEKVNAEFCALVVDIYRLHEKCNLTLDDM